MKESKVHVLRALDLVVGSGSQTSEPRRARKPTLANAIKEARRAGANITGATLTLDGRVSLTFGGKGDSESQEMPEDLRGLI